MPNVLPVQRLAWLVAAALWLALAWPSAGLGQQVMRIVAVVNDEVISLYDLDSRLRLVIRSSALPDTPETRARVTPQVLRSLIDERLQRQEADRLGINVTESEIDQAIARLEAANRVPRGGFEEFLRRNGLERATVVDQIRASLAWQKVVTRRLRPTLEVSEEEVDEQLSRLRSAQGVTEHLLAEIFLAVDSPEQDEEVRQTATGLIEQMVRGAPFSSVAQQFSQSASAAIGGDIGWVQSGQFEDTIDQAISALRPGQVTPPLRSVAGYYIYFLRDRRQIAGPSPEQAMVSLGQLLVPLERGASEADIVAVDGLLQQVREVVSGCNDLERAASEMGARWGGPPQRLKVSDLAPNLRPIVAGLKVGELGPATRIDSGVLAIMVCAREDAPSNLPTRDEISNQLTRQRLDLIARRYLRDLRRTAVVDIRV